MNNLINSSFIDLLGFLITLACAINVACLLTLIIYAAFCALTGRFNKD